MDAAESDSLVEQTRRGVVAVERALSPPMHLTVCWSAQLGGNAIDCASHAAVAGLLGTTNLHLRVDFADMNKALAQGEARLPAVGRAIFNDDFELPIAQGALILRQIKGARSGLAFEARLPIALPRRDIQVSEFFTLYVAPTASLPVDADATTEPAVIELRDHNDVVVAAGTLTLHSRLFLQRLARLAV